MNGVIRHGKCATCGRFVPGELIDARLAKGECPRCGALPFYMDSVGPWTENIAVMNYDDAIALVHSLDDEETIEVLFRVEFMGLNRDLILHELHERYWKIHDVPPSATARGRAMTLDELRAAWAAELRDPSQRRMYERLSEIPVA